jgi:hypothetical protein
MPERIKAHHFTANACSMRSIKKMTRMCKIKAFSLKPQRIGRRRAVWSCKAPEAGSCIAGTAKSQNFSEMKGAAVGELRDLLAATEAVGNDEGGGSAGFNGRDETVAGDGL